MKSIATALIAVGLGACASASSSPVSAEPLTPTVSSPYCTGQAGLDFICGLPSIEDFAVLPRTSLLIGASYPLRGGVGGLYLIDSRTRTWRSIPLGRAADQMRKGFDCDSPPDWSSFVAHGIALQDGAGSDHTLYVVNHGSRQAIEVFELSGDGAAATWVGCLPMPEGLVPNSVALAPDGALYFTVTFDPEPWPVLVERLTSRREAGGVYEWRPGSDVRRVATPIISGPNGLEISPDGATLFVSGWGDGTLTRVELATGAFRQTQFDVLADNLRWAPDGSLILAGQVTTVVDSVTCGSASPPRGRYCAMHGLVLKIDPATLAPVGRWDIQGATDFGDLTVALEHEGKFWLGSLFGDRIALMDARPPTTTP